jgi:hypothetical protein
MAACQAADSEAQVKDTLLETTVLLSHKVEAELQKLLTEGASKPAAKQLLLCYRAVQGQRFLARQVDAVRQKGEWIEAEFQKYAPKRPTTTKENQDKFYERLLQVCNDIAFNAPACGQQQYDPGPELGSGAGSAIVASLLQIDVRQR